jgi:hypothetical protein
MKIPRVRFTVRRMMAVVLAVALLLAGFRDVVRSFPHVRRCWQLAAEEERLSGAYRRAACRYRTCVQALPCSASEYCGNFCLDHVSSPAAKRWGYPMPTAKDRARAEDAHLRAAEDHERAADAHAARAGRYRRAMFCFSEPLPSWTADEESVANAFARYPCDQY